MIYGSLEMEIMNSIWQLHEQDEDMNISVKEVVETLSAQNIHRAYTTVKTVMDRLTQKGLLVRYKNDKKFFYREVSSRIETASEAVKTLSSQFFNGSYVSLIHFIEKEYEQLSV